MQRRVEGVLGQHGSQELLVLLLLLPATFALRFHPQAKIEKRGGDGGKWMNQTNLSRFEVFRRRTIVSLFLGSEETCKNI